MPDLPAGTVTFLFSDIEGSTQLLHTLRHDYAGVLADQRQLLRAAFARWNGHEVDTQSDAFFVAFARAREAVAAAAQAQRALAAHSWPAGLAVRVRMALHTGEPALASTGYVGIDVHRAARICAAGHGGQVLLSQTTRDLVENDLPAGTGLLDLGQHRLKDLQRPEHIFELSLPDLPADFPPLKSLDAFRHNLPIQLTSFVGRQKEMAEVKGLLAATRMLTLTGPGGTGKTRLALQVAADVLEAFADGVWFVELSPLADPALVPQTVAATLGVREEHGRPILRALTDYVRAKHLLLLVDNCEHLIEACAHLADTMLHACPNVRILATSGEALGIAGETTYGVGSLGLPDLRRLPDVESLSQYEAVRLFIDRATAVRGVPAFSVTDQNAAALAQVCHRLGGIPLAIELAAARVKMLTVEQIAARLDDRFRLLTGGSRTGPHRHQTLRATMEWSYDLLSETERALLARLSVFAGGWTLEAAEAVCAPSPPTSPRIAALRGQFAPLPFWDARRAGGGEGPEVLDLLTQLVNKSLVVVEREQAEERRYRMLETVRQYAHEKLLDAGETNRIRDRHLQFFVTFAEEMEPRLRGAEQIPLLNRLEQEHDNLRAALQWSVEGGDAEGGLRIAGAVGRFWAVRSYLSAERRWLKDALAQNQVGQRTAARAKALCWAGILAEQGDARERADGRTLYVESLAIWREIGDPWWIAFVQAQQGWWEIYDEKPAAARPLCEEAVSLARQVKDKWLIAQSLRSLAAVVRREDPAAARPILEECVSLLREVGDGMALNMALGNLGRVFMVQHDLDRAATLYEESLVLSRAGGAKNTIAEALYSLGDLAQERGDDARAAAYFAEGLALAHESGRNLDLALSLEKIGGLAASRGRASRAARLLGAAESLLDALGRRLAIWPEEAVGHERAVALVRSQLDEAAINAAWAEGRAMTLEQAVAYALSAEE